MEWRLEWLGESGCSCIITPGTFPDHEANPIIRLGDDVISNDLSPII